MGVVALHAPQDNYEQAVDENESQAWNESIWHLSLPLGVLTDRTRRPALWGVSFDFRLMPFVVYRKLCFNRLQFSLFGGLPSSKLLYGDALDVQPPNRTFLVLAEPRECAKGNSNVQ